ncbi:MAG: DedA family protein [bacterium]|nr:DedA family protein [bacterium]
MEYIAHLIDLIIHLDKHLENIIRQYHYFTYLILFLIIFCETGLVITPFLPGDSLLFAAGTLAAITILDPILLFILLTLAAIIGDSVNYSIGLRIGDKVYSKPSKIFKKEYLDKTHEFYEKYGGKTIVIARFVPIVRTFAPFVAGVGKMTYSKFLTFNVTGGILWVGLLVSAGYFFGNLPFIKKNFSLVILLIIFLSILPAIIEYLRAKRNVQ